jgi:hypothetical protein
VGGVERCWCKTLHLIVFIACCLGAIKPREKLEVGDSVSTGDSILLGVTPFGLL